MYPQILLISNAVAEVAMSLKTQSIYETKLWLKIAHSHKDLNWLAEIGFRFNFLTALNWLEKWHRACLNAIEQNGAASKKELTLTASS